LKIGKVSSQYKTRDYTLKIDPEKPVFIKGHWKKPGHHLNNPVTGAVYG